jgi:hypothetical protein
VHNRHPYARVGQERTRLRHHQSHQRRRWLGFGPPQRPRQTSPMRSSLLHPRGLARALNADPGATPHLCLIQMNCNISSFEAPQNSMTRVTGKGYFRGRARNQYSVNTVSSVSRNHSAISFNWKGRSSSSRSRLSKLGDFASSTWFPDRVQRSQNVVTERTTRIRNLFHCGFHLLEELTH